MTLPLDTFIDKSYEEGWNDIRDMYRNIAETVNGTYYNTTPVIYGSTTAGALTYVTQTGYQLRQGILIDVWFDIEWGDIGGAAGNIQLDLSYKSAKSSGSPFTTAIYGSGCSYSANYEYLTIVLAGGATIATIYENGSGVTAQPLDFAISGNSGTLRGHLRYIGQEFS